MRRIENQKTREGSMVTSLSLIATLLGAASAHLAGRFHAHREAIETGAGFLLIGGLMLMGSVLPAVL
jgi:hypothetical protein